MNYVVTSVYDHKASYYSAPMVTRTTGEAIRMFGDACKNSDTAFNKHPEDYSLFHLANFNADTGEIEPEKTPKKLINGNDV